MFDTPSYRTLSACELVDMYEAHKAGRAYDDPRTTPVTVEQWTLNSNQGLTA